MNSVKQAYRNFLNTPDGARLYRQFKQLLYAKEDSLVQWLNTSIIWTLPAVRGSSVRICDIGGGDGDRVTRIVRSLHEKFRSRFRLDFVEQSAFYAAAFDTSPIAEFCRTTVHHKLFEEATLRRGGYDLVLLIHSIFTFENGYSTEKVLSLRRPNGSIIVVSNAHNSFLAGLKRLVDTGYSDRRFEISNLEDTLRQLGVRYNRHSTFTEWAVENRTWKRDREVLLDWICLGRYHSLKRGERRLIDEYLSYHGKRIGSRIFFVEEEIALVIPC